MLGFAPMSIVDAAHYLFTSESVTEGHPDKMCDQVSDAILDAIIREDPNARVACETATTTGLVMVLGEISTTHLHRHPGSRPRHRPRHRLHPGRLRLRLPDLRHADLGQGAVARHRAGRRLGARGPRRRGIHVRARGRRPGDDVRLRLPRDARADAAADRPRPSDGAPPVRGPQDRPAPVPAPRRQDPGHGRVRARRAQAGPHRGRRRPARPRRPRRAAAPGDRRSGHPADDPVRAPRHGPGHARQPDRPLRHRWPDGRRRPDRSQDHRRQLRRDGPSRRRRLLGQGSDQGRPLGGLRGPLGGQERGGRRPRRPVRGRGRLRHRDRPADQLQRRLVRDRTDRRRGDPGAHRSPLRPASGLDHRGPRPAPADLPPDRGVRPLRTA